MRPVSGRTRIAAAAEFTGAIMITPPKCRCGTDPLTYVRGSDFRSALNFRPEGKSKKTLGFKRDLVLAPGPDSNQRLDG
jgi:hypothetical protein